MRMLTGEADQQTMSIALAVSHKQTGRSGRKKADLISQQNCSVDASGINTTLGLGDSFSNYLNIAGPVVVLIPGFNYLNIAGPVVVLIRRHGFGSQQPHAHRPKHAGKQQTSPKPVGTVAAWSSSLRREQQRASDVYRRAISARHGQG